MANATATLTLNRYPNGVDDTQRRIILYGICALSGGGTYITFGIPLTTGTGWGFIAQDGGVAVPNIGAGALPQWAEFVTTASSGYQYTFDQVHGTLRIFNGGTELANAAAITADTIAFRAEFNRGTGGNGY